MRGLTSISSTSFEFPSNNEVIRITYQIHFLILATHRSRAGLWILLTKYRFQPIQRHIGKGGRDDTTLRRPIFRLVRDNLSMYPAFSHVLRMALSIGICVSNHAWLILSKHDVMSPSSIHCALVLCESTVAHCSIASAQLRSCLNPYEFGLTFVSAMGSRACKYNACIALSFIVGIPRGRFFPLDLGIYTLRNGRALYPLFCSWCMAISLLTGSVQIVPDRHPECFCLGSLSLVVRQELCRCIGFWHIT